MNRRCLRGRRTKPARTPGFTLVEVLVATGLSVFILAGVLTSNLQIIRSGVRITQYAEMESQVRRALDYFGRDVKSAVKVTWNGDSDVTLTIPSGSGTTAQITYAWTPASETFFRVAGASSTTLVGRLELVRGIQPLPGGAPGLTFARFDRDGAPATTDATTRSILVTMNVTRSATTMPTASQNAVSALFTLRNKTTS